MSIRPVDLQVLVQKSAEINRMTNGAERQDANNAQMFTDIIKKEVQHNEKQVNNAHKSEQEGVDKDGKGRNAYHGSSGGKKQQKEQEKPKPKSTSMFDVTI